MLLGLIISLLLLIIGTIIISNVIYILKSFLKCIFCCPGNNQEENNINLGDDIELQNINENQENNRNLVNP